MKLVLAEEESVALRRFLDQTAPTATSCEIAVVEVARAARRSDPTATDRVAVIMREVKLIRLSQDLYHDARAVDPPDLGTLDALHIAAALRLGRELDALVTYDRRMQRAARALGFAVEAPA